MSVQATRFRFALIVMVLSHGICFGEDEATIEKRNHDPTDATECGQRFMALHDRLQKNWCVYGRCSVLETMSFSPGEMRSEWFEAWGEKDKKQLRYRHCVRRYEGVSLFSPTTIDSVLHVNGKQRYTTASPTRSLKLIAVSDERLDAWGVKNRKLDDIFNVGRFPTPELFHAVLVPGPFSIEQMRPSDILDRFFLLNFHCSFSEKSNNGDIVGVWVPRKPMSEQRASRIVFGKEAGFLPTLTQTYYLNEPLPMGVNIDLKQAIPWYEVRIKWQKQEAVERSQQEEYVPVQIVNTTFRVNRAAKEGAELQILAAWQPFKFDDVKVSFSEEGKAVTENGFEKLHRQLEERFEKEHGE